MYFWLIFGSLVFFVVSEKTFVHFSRTARRVFWYLLSCAVGLWLVRLLQTVEGAGMLWVFLSAVLAASVVEDEVAKKTFLTAMDIEATAALRDALRTPEAQGRAERLMDIVNYVTQGQGYTMGTKQLVIRATGTTRRLQSALRSVLEGASAAELNYLLCAVNAPALVEVVGRAAMDTLTGERLADLTTVARAVLVDALQKVGLRYRPRRQAWAAKLLLDTRGAALTALKAYVDDGGDYHSTYKLIYHDLQGETQRAVLAHIAREGAAALAEHRAAVAAAATACGAPPLPPPPGLVLKVVSDVDDTMFASGGKFPAGIDTRYPRKCYYPGALALYSELDRSFARRYASAVAAVRNAAMALPGGRSLARRNSEDDGEEVMSLGSPRGSTPRACGALGRELSMQGSSSLPGPDALPGAPPNGPPSQSDATPTPTPPATPMHAAQGLLDPGSPRLGGAFLLGTPPKPQAPIAGGSLPGLLPRPPRINAARRRPGAPASGGGASAVPHQEGSNLVFLSARPQSYKGMTESDAYKKYFAPLVMRGDLDACPSMLLGSLDSGPRALLRLLLPRWAPGGAPGEAGGATAALYATLAARKVSRLRDYVALYPEACFVFMGDNGQGDVVCAEVMASSLGRPRLLAALMHKVVPLASTYSMVRSPKGDLASWLAAWHERSIYFSRTHVGMAVQAFALGLLGTEALHRVCAAAATDFHRIWGRYAGRNAGRNLAQALAELNEDLRAANSLLPERLRMGPVSVGGLVPAPTAGSYPPPPPSPSGRSEAGSEAGGSVFVMR